jgi:archaellum component FlaC
MKDAVHKAIENEIQFQKDLQGIKRLTQQKRDEIINYSSIINELKTLYKTL